MSHSPFTELLLYFGFGTIIWPKRSCLNFVKSILDWFSFLFRPFPIILLLLASYLSSTVFFMLLIIALTGSFKECFKVVIWPDIVLHKKISRKLLGEAAMSVSLSEQFQKQFYMHGLYHPHFYKALNLLWVFCQADTSPCHDHVRGRRYLTILDDQSHFSCSS